MEGVWPWSDWIIRGVCIPDWKEIRTLPEEARLLCYGQDFGYTNDPSSLVALYKYNDSFIFDEVIYQKKLLNSDISDLYNTYGVNEVVYADSAEPKSIAELCGYGHDVVAVTKGRDSIVYGINLMNQNEIYVTSKSKNLIKELSNYTWMTDKEGNKLNKPIDAFNHAIDAARYALTSQLEDPNRGKYFVF
ncbi:MULTISPECIES: terminase large subunit [Bacteria]|uniref:terminase large subunit n=1 Tax=Bacteria TaxID=2 RepID=UPI00159BD823|nr:terminase large subunit [Escherichia fergusonii]